MCHTPCGQGTDDAQCEKVVGITAGQYLIRAHTSPHATVMTSLVASQCASHEITWRGSLGSAAALSGDRHSPWQPLAHSGRLPAATRCQLATEWCGRVGSRCCACCCVGRGCQRKEIAAGTGIPPHCLLPTNRSVSCLPSAATCNQATQKVMMGLPSAGCSIICVAGSFK